MTILGPNTMFTPDMLSEDIVLSCGEDPTELLECLAQATGAGIPSPHRYRGFGCVKLPSMSVVWGGMGTGTLEPFLWEVLKCEKVKRIVLVGTTGLLAPCTEALGNAFLITEAYLAGTALDEEWITQPLRPSFRDLDKAANLPRSSIVSTDFYYGFAGNKQRQGYPPITQRIEKGFQGTARSASLTDMETAQFYFFCSAFREKGTLDYLGIKGPANPVLATDAQVVHSANVLAKAIRLAKEVFTLTTCAV